MHGNIGIDASGRTRVSQLTTLGDYKMVGEFPALALNAAGTGTGAWAESKYSMSVAGNQYLVLQSRVSHPYFSGKSQTVEITFDRFQHEAGITKRVGYFSSSATPPYTANLDGIFLESDGSHYYIKVYRNGTLTVSVIDQAWDNWSEIQGYDWSFFTVILIDFLWLGGAVARLWIKKGDSFILAHAVHYAGTAENIFCLSPSQPLRIEIRASNAGGQLRYVCSQVATEGSIDESGYSGSVNTTSSAISLASAGTTYPLIAIRKKSAFINAAVKIKNLAIDVGSTADRLLWSLQLNPTLSAGLTYGDLANYPIQFALGNGTITVSSPGTVLISGFLQTGALIPTGIVTTNYLMWLGNTIAGVMDQFVLCATPITNTISAHGEIAFKKY